MKDLHLHERATKTAINIINKTKWAESYDYIAAEVLREYASALCILAKQDFYQNGFYTFSLFSFPFLTHNLDINLPLKPMT